MDEIRVQALRYACIAMRGAPFTEITKAAESFESFLRGNGEEPPAIQETVGQPSATDLSQADQTPDRPVFRIGTPVLDGVPTWDASVGGYTNTTGL